MLPPRALEPGNVGVCFGCMKPFRVTHAGLVTVRDAEIQSTPGLRSEIDKVVSVAKRD
jgi:hypothetical protein